MGTTLTGTTPQDTYDSLIKVTDNGPLSGTLKALSDGLGNDSTLSLSTTAASIAGTLAVAGAATFDTTTLVVDAANDRVGIGTSTPDVPLDVVRGSSGTVATFGIEGLTINPKMRIVCNEVDNTVAFNPNYNGGTSPSILFLTTEVERMRITATGVIELARGQIKFPASQVASSDPNTLDDYEEGTFTPTFVGATISGGNIRGSYTKIGRQVYVTVQFVNATISSSAGNASIQSLPFTNNALYFGVATITYCDALNTTNASAWIDTSSTTIVLMDGTGTGSFASFVDGTASRSIMINAVYQV